MRGGGVKRPEILAPAGNVESAYAAINAGCDAIYMGGEKYGARAFAGNPDDEALKGIIDDAHFYGKKIYVTANTILGDSDFPGLYDFVKLVYEAGADAVIVQDLGAMRFIHNEFPDLPIHASTQMNITCAGAAGLLKSYGVTRIIPARELDLSELGDMRRHTELEIEVFVHGALCFSYSGQCLMSSLIGGRSGNRGACAQPCRKRYFANGGKAVHMLSLKDLCGIEYIPELMRLNIDSFKIEGRMKKPEYVALSVYMYKKYADMFLESGEGEFGKELESDVKLLKDIYNRGGFTCGYLAGDTVRQNMVSEARPGHMGLRVGKVTGLDRDKAGAEIEFTEKANVRDVLEVRNSRGEPVRVHTLKEAHGRGERVWINVGYDIRGMSEGMEVFRMRDEALIGGILEKFPVYGKKKGIKGIFTARTGEEASLKIWLSDSPEDCYTACGEPVLTAENRPVSAEIIKDKVMVSGDSPFEWESLDIDADDGIFINMGGLKKLRRTAFRGLYRHITDPFHRTLSGRLGFHGGEDAGFRKGNGGSRELIAECRNVLQFECVNGIARVGTIYMHMEDMDMGGITEVLDSAKKPVFLVMPRIFRLKGQEYFNKEYDMDKIRSYPYFKGMVACCLEELAWLKSGGYADGMEIRTAENLYSANTWSRMFLKETGVSLCQSPGDASYKERLDAARQGFCDFAAYGRSAAMVSAVSVGHDKIRDSYGNAYPVKWHEKFGYAEIMHYEAADYTGRVKEGGFNRIRLSFWDEEPCAIKEIISRIGEMAV